MAKAQQWKPFENYGDYGKTSNPDMLATKFRGGNTGGPSEEVARLVGARFVNISEPEKKITFNAALVKRMTGNDTINARFLNENSFDFVPVFKIFINTNYLPNVNDMTLFQSGRLKIIPFNRHFEEGEQDQGLKGQFAKTENLSGIFNWCLEGYKKFCQQGLDIPDAVKITTEDYKDDLTESGSSSRHGSRRMKMLNFAPPQHTSFIQSGVRRTAILPRTRKISKMPSVFISKSCANAQRTVAGRQL